ncbi:Uncharacterised protein [Shigella sonnei]|nr:Uncharacterised protein [Shigella sonnei]CSF04327.1 Uncharacterised protein [Shigella sonnei]CSF04945.1 Uncharacterised protein [Shigella sonnei]CSF35942.1 Uncharacterised protein [Shigella sonnei]CSF46496.1 Uncharacterised protein [Shigella sonnei]
MANITSVVGAFLTITGTFVVTLILHREVQTIYQTEEISITISRDAVGTTSHKVVCIGIRVTAKFRQHIGPAFDVVHYAIITSVIERTVICKFQPGKCQTGP